MRKGGTTISAQPELGQRLRQLRLARGLSQTDLASNELSASYVSLIESGRREPTQRALEVLAGHLAVDPDLLLTGVDPSEAESARLTLTHAELALRSGSADEAAAGFAEVAASGSTDTDMQWRARFGLAEAAERQGDLEQAIRSFEALRNEAEARPRDLPWLPTISALARCYRDAGDLARAIDLAEEALRRCHVLGLLGVDGHVELVSTLASTYYERGDLLRAATLLDDLIGRVESEGSRRDRIAALWNASIVAADRHEEADALRLADRALLLLQEEESEHEIARLQITRAWMLLQQATPKPSAARDLLLDLIPVLERLGYDVDVAYAQTELARAYAMLGDHDNGRLQAEQALAALGSDARLEQARSRAVLGQCLRASGDEQGALRSYRKAAEGLAELGAGRQSAAVWRDLADALSAAGQHDEAAAAFRQALDGLGVRGTA